MDIDDVVIEVLRLAEQIELDSTSVPHIYTCIINPRQGGGGIFSEVVLTGEVCVCAHTRIVAELLFFLLNGIYDFEQGKMEWYNQVLEGHDDLTAEDALDLWIKWYTGTGTAEVTEHDITRPIVVQPITCDGLHGMVTLTPSMCDIWTLPRIKRQFD